MLPDVYLHMASQFLSVKYTTYGLFIKIGLIIFQTYAFTVCSWCIFHLTS